MDLFLREETLFVITLICSSIVSILAARKCMLHNEALHTELRGIESELQRLQNKIPGKSRRTEQLKGVLVPMKHKYQKLYGYHQELREHQPEEEKKTGNKAGRRQGEIEISKHRLNPEDS